MNPKEKAAMLADREIKAIVFDLGDTIFNFGEVRAVDLFRKSARLSYEYIKSAGQEPGGYKSYCFFNMAGLRLKILWSNITGNDFNSIDVLKSIGRKRGIRLSDEQWQEVNWMWYKSLEEITTIEADIVETLSRLKEAGVALGIISNTFVHRHALERHLEEAGILEFFETRLYSYQFKWRKPDKRIFLAAAERILIRLSNADPTDRGELAAIRSVVIDTGLPARLAEARRGASGRRPALATALPVEMILIRVVNGAPGEASEFKDIQSAILDSALIERTRALRSSL